MITFLDGPAKDVADGLCLRRAPYFLRVTCKPGRTRLCKPTWDGLDQPTDMPEAAETIYAYRLKKHRGSCHIRSGRRTGSGFFQMADYEFFPDQPADEVLRDPVAWANWCHAEYAKIEVAEKAAKENHD